MKKISFVLWGAIALFCLLLSRECYATAYGYVSNSADDTVSVISTSDNTVTTTIDVGDGPLGVAVNPSGDYVYVTNNLDDTVSVISTSDNTVTTTIDVGDGPWGVAVTPSGDYVYVANNLKDTVSVISTSDNTVTTTISVGDSPAGFGMFIGGKAPEAPSDLVATTVSDSQIDLSWADNSDDEMGFKIERKMYGEAFTQIGTVSANVTSYSDTGLSSNGTYYYRVRAYNNAGNSDYSDEAYATTDEEEGVCFIVTAAYGSPLEPHVKVLGEFRDRVLLTSRGGRAFVDLYYTYSPPVADFIANHDTLRGMVRWSLLPLVGVSWMTLHFGPWATVSLMGLLFGLMATTVIFFAIKGHRKASELKEHQEP